MAECNSLDLLQYCHEELQVPWHSAEITTAAAKANNRTACAAYLRQQGLEGVNE
eukprot:gene9316-10976_t